jgi:hypothetical protein
MLELGHLLQQEPERQPARQRRFACVRASKVIDREPSLEPSAVGAWLVN